MSRPTVTPSSSSIAGFWPWLCCGLCSLVIAAPVHAQVLTSSTADVIVPFVYTLATLDTDGDGIPDEWETKVFHTDPSKADMDGDGFSDLVEIKSGFSPMNKKAVKLAPGDFDKDGLNDRLELFFGTDPTNPDSNADGISDGGAIELAMSPTSTPAVPLVKSIRIVLATQRLERQVAGVAIDSNPVSTGKASTPTPVGTYHTLNKIPRAWSRMAGLWMPNWMAISTLGYGIHELPEWPSGYKEGQAHLGRPVSHGCIRLGVGTAKMVYDWAPIGTTVTIVKK